MQMHHRRPSFGAVALGILATALLSLAACGGGDDDDDESSPSATEASPEATQPLPAVADVAPELVGLGDLATLHSQPASETFGPDGGELSLADGATVEVPEGAFTEPVELTVAIVDVEVEDPVQELRVYRLSTEEDISPLDPPVVLEVPQLADQVMVAELQDGEWRALAVSTSTTTRVKIDHFSEFIGAFGHCQHLVLGFADQADKYFHPNLPVLAGLVCQSITEPDFGLDLTGEDQAFINNLVNIIADDLRRAGASSGPIATARITVRNCLTRELLAEHSHETAAGACDPTFAPEPEPEPADPGTGAGTEPEPADPGTEPEPADPGTEPDPDPDPDPEPEPEPEPAVSITILGHTIEHNSEVFCTPNHFLCKFIVTVTVEYSATIDARISCSQISSGSIVSGQNVPAGSAVVLTLATDIFSSPPEGSEGPLFCSINTELGFVGPGDSDNTPMNPPPPFVNGSNQPP